MRTKRITAALLCLVIVLGTCACSKPKQTGKHFVAKTLSHKVSDEPLELTLFAKDIESAREECIFPKAYDLTNVLLKPVLSENVNDMDQALALAMAAKDIPDIIYDWKQKNFNRYGSQGALIPLNDLIDQYAPNYKKFLEENPDVKYFATAADGNMYFIPFVSDGEASTGWFIRQDWLDKLNLKAPDTVEEFYDVMVAFRDRDPNGNGQKDEIPYFGMRDGDIDSLLSLFDVYENFRYENGRVSYGPLEEGFLPAMKTITKWYREGLIDPEFYTRRDAQYYLTSGNAGGITHDWFGSTANTNDSLQEMIPGYKLVPFAPPKGPDGVRRERNRRTRVSGEGWGISATNQYPEETMKFFDFWFTEEGRRLVNFGLEGIHHNMVEGKPVLTDSVLNGKVPAGSRMNKTRGRINFGFWQDYGYEAQWSNKIGLEGAAMYVKEGYLPKPETRPALSYFEDEKQHNVLQTQIETYRDEMIQYWFFGVKDPEEAYGVFNETLRALGVEEYIAIEQKAYDQYLAFMHN